MCRAQVTWYLRSCALGVRVQISTGDIKIVQDNFVIVNAIAPLHGPLECTGSVAHSYVGGAGRPGGRQFT